MSTKKLAKKAEKLLGQYRKKKLKIATAESCTGGMIATLITEHMGGAAASAPKASALPAEPLPTDDVDLEALTDEEIDRLLDDAEVSAGNQQVLETQV